MVDLEAETDVLCVLEHVVSGVADGNKSSFYAFDVVLSLPPPRFPRVDFFYEIAGKPTLEIFRGIFFCQKFSGRPKFRVESL